MFGSKKNFPRRKKSSTSLKEEDLIGDNSPKFRRRSTRRMMLSRSSDSFSSSKPEPSKSTELSKKSPFYSAIVSVLCGRYHIYILTNGGDVFKTKNGSSNKEKKNSEKGRMELNRLEISECIVKMSLSIKGLFLLSITNNVYWESCGEDTTKPLLLKSLFSFNTEKKICDVVCTSNRIFFLMKDGEVFTVQRIQENGGGSCESPPILIPSKYFNGESIAKLKGMGHHFFFYSKKGNFFCFSSNNETGALGLGDLKNRNVPVLFPFKHGKIKFIDVGLHHTILITNDNRVFSFGSNSNGQLTFNKDEEIVESPRLVECFDGKDIEIIRIKAGWLHSFFWDSKNNFYACGRNNSFQIHHKKSVDVFIPVLINHGICANKRIMDVVSNEKSCVFLTRLNDVLVTGDLARCEGEQNWKCYVSGKSLFRCQVRESEPEFTNVNFDPSVIEKKFVHCKEYFSSYLNDVLKLYEEREFFKNVNNKFKKFFNSVNFEREKVNKLEFTFGSFKLLKKETFFNYVQHTHDVKRWIEMFDKEKKLMMINERLHPLDFKIFDSSLKLFLEASIRFISHFFDFKNLLVRFILDEKSLIPSCVIGENIDRFHSIWEDVQKYYKNIASDEKLHEFYSLCVNKEFNL